MFTPLTRSSSDGEGARPADLLGHLLIVEPTEYIASMNTSMGETDAVACKVIDLDAGKEYPSTLFFNAALKKDLKDRIGQQLVVRMAQGEAKPGKSAPYILNDAYNDAVALKKATDYITGKAAASLTPVTPAAAPTSDGNEATIAALLAQLGAKAV